MAEKSINRIIICVDGAEFDENGRIGHENASNIFRIKNVFATGTTYDDQDRAINQIVRYYQTSSEGRTGIGRLKGRSVGSIDQQVKEIARDICQQLESPSDELCFYGFGRGAYIVRAVACAIHYMGLPKSFSNFDGAFSKALEMERARQLDDSLNGNKLLSQLKVLCNDSPIIRFLGVFDTIKPSLERHQYEISLVPSIQTARHAVAFNESRLLPELFDPPPAEAMEGRSHVQAWFLGAHHDLGGGTQHDGLSLYPFQWMLIESMKAGIVLDKNRTDGVLQLAFPQFAGNLPRLDGGEKIEWRIKYANNLFITMFDVASLHAESKNESTHTIRINQGSNVFNSQRKIWNNSTKALLGYNEKGQNGTIIHPSLYAILDRNPKMYDSGLFRLRKLELSDFQERCMDDQGEMQPWLEGLHLQASGVKAFRILVCGKTGVGKSTLINKVFGVEMTEESTNYSQGQHDINTAFESPNHPGLLIHDSRGWQAGSDQELDLIGKFLRHRAFQKDPAESLHVIWFCVDSDVSRIEEADKRTFATIAQYSNHVPVFVVGTKKDKLVAYRKMELLEAHMQKTNDYKAASKLAAEEAGKLADDQFMKLKDQLSEIEHYKADGYCCISKDDDSGVKTLLNQTLDLIADERVRIFCVAAQVMDVEQKIDSAITECMRLGAHAIRTAMVPLPFSGMIGTPTVSRIICEHVLQCFGFPKAAPEAVEEIMSRVVMGNLKSFLKVTLAQFSAVSLTAIGVGVPTLGIGTIIGGIGCILATPPTARMLFKCACDMILILERSFRYQGRYVSVKQIEDAAVYYTTATTKTFSGKEVLLQRHIHDEVDRLIPLKKISIGFRFGRLRSGLQDIIYMNRFDKKVGAPLSSVSSTSLTETTSRAVSMDAIPELEAPMNRVELDPGSDGMRRPTIPEMMGDTKQPTEIASPSSSHAAATTATSGISPMTSRGGGTVRQNTYGSSELSSEAGLTTFSSVDGSSIVTSPTVADDMSTAGTLIGGGAAAEMMDGDGKRKGARRWMSESSTAGNDSGEKKEPGLFKRSLSKWSLKKTKTADG